MAAWFEAWLVAQCFVQLLRATMTLFCYIVGTFVISIILFNTCSVQLHVKKASRCAKLPAKMELATL